jgi:hypothetical protein
MKHPKIALALAAVASLTLSGSVWANGSADPKLPKEVQNMYCLVGSWQGNLTLGMGAEKAKLSASIDCSPTSNGFAIQCKARMTGLPGGAVAEETDLFGWDPGANKYHWFSVTNMGETHDHVADVSAGDTVKWLYKGTMEGKPFEEALSMKFGKNSTSMVLRSTSKSAGKVVSTLDGTLHKK